MQIDVSATADERAALLNERIEELEARLEVVHQVMHGILDGIGPMILAFGFPNVGPLFGVIQYFTCPDFHELQIDDADGRAMLNQIKRSSLKMLHMAHKDTRAGRVRRVPI
jgi:hypothetical protein